MLLGKNSVILADARKLLQKKYRQSYGLFLIEGEKLVRDAVRFGIELKSIFIAASKEEAFADLTASLSCSAYVIADAEMKTLSDTVTPQGVVAVCKIPEESIGTGDMLVLDGVQDPSNMGVILRTACGAGFCNVFCIDCVDPFSPKCIRSGMSSQFVLNIVCGSADVLYGLLSGREVIVADMGGEDVADYARSRNKNAPIALVLGSEGMGVSRIMRERADRSISVRMENGLESLNVAVSAGIIMYILKIYF
ncbi:MAG: RNA methyltransferase [Clostridia bacterium]|nr:RNA methyltransferase [Clostridia bacterium]